MTSKKKLLALGAVLLLLAASFWYGGGAPGSQGEPSAPQGAAAPATPPGKDAAAPGAQSASASVPQAQAQPAPDAAPDGREPSPAPAPPECQPDAAQPSPAPDAPAGGAQLQAEAPSAGQEEPPATGPREEASCTLSIRCDAVLDHLDELDTGLAQLIPADGVILAQAQAPFEEGDTAFSLLQRLTRQEGIHLEASFTPGYGSSYVEGIANLYEFDCGPQSGWLYLVNGVSPGQGSSQCALSPGDTVEWIYTCDMGADAGVTP